MKILLLLLSLNVFSQDDFYRPWPSVIDANSFFYRGQSTYITSVKTMLDMLISPNENSFITSRLMRSLKKLNPDKTYKELAFIIDKQILWWKDNSVLWKVSECHVAVYGCTMPTVSELMGDYFSLSDLPDFMQMAFQRQLNGDIPYLDIHDMERVLSFFDPVVSTSYYQEVAEKFANDKKDGYGYVMILNDQFDRNCDAESKEKVNCFISIEDYYDEYEFPFWGYVTSYEFNGFTKEGILINKNNNHVYITQGNFKELLSCKSLKKINWKNQTFKKDLFNYFQCHN